MTRLALTTLCLSLAACQPDPTPAANERSEPLTREDVPLATAADLPKLDASEYRRTLADQLELVPVGADWLVIRDLRPLIGEARTLEQVLAGPLARALPTLIQASAADLAEFEADRQTLALVLAGLESTGLALDQGAVISEVEGQPVILFAAADLQKLGLIASLAGPELDLANSCGPVVDSVGWWVCSLAGPAGLAKYRAGHVGAQRLAELAAQLPGVDLERINVAVSVRATPEPSQPPATPSVSPPASPVSVVLQTDPGLWELSMPLPTNERTAAGASLLVTGSAPALRSLAPDAGFVWARWDPTLADPNSGGLALPLEILTGEVFMAPLAEPSALVLRAGITEGSAGEAAKLIQQLATLLPSKPLEPESMPGAKLEIDRKPIDLDGVLIPALGFTGTGAPIESMEKTLGLPTRGRLWAFDEYLSFGYGELDGLPEALERQRGAGPSPAVIAGLPPTLARALLAGQVGFVVHLVLDPWLAPLSEPELTELFANLPAGERPDAATVGQVFSSFAPWSSLSVWLERRSAADPWIAHATLVPFVLPISPAEIEASKAALATVLAGGDASAAYRDLLARFPSSPRASAWRARLGEAPKSFAAMGMMQFGLLAVVAVPALVEYMARAKANEAIERTQAILAAALALRERNGNCASSLGTAGPTPALSVDCNAGEGGRCRPGVEGYPISAWTDDPVWAAIGWQPKQGHRFHYAFEGSEAGGECTLTVRASADLDADGTFSTYTRATTIAADGSQRSPGLQISGEGE